MTLANLASIATVISSVAVLASLIYLALQLKQTEKNQRAQIRQTHSMRISEAFQRRMDHADLWLKAYSGEPLADAEVYQVFQAVSAVWFGIEDSYYQHRDGLLDEAAGQANLTGLKLSLRMPQFRAVWPFMRPNAVGPDFVTLVDKLIAETPPVSSHELISQYRKSLEREMQAAKPGGFFAEEKAP